MRLGFDRLNVLRKRVFPLKASGGYAAGITWAQCMTIDELLLGREDFIRHPLHERTPRQRAPVPESAHGAAAWWTTWEELAGLPERIETCRIQPCLGQRISLRRVARRTGRPLGGSRFGRVKISTTRGHTWCSPSTTTGSGGVAAIPAAATARTNPAHPDEGTGCRSGAGGRESARGLNGLGRRAQREPRAVLLPAPGGPRAPDGES